MSDPTVAFEITPEPIDAPDVPGLDVQCVLGEGGVGRVFLARHARLGRLVALKVLLGRDPGDPDGRRFRLEAEAVAAITHPNVVAVHECGEHAGRPYLVLEYAPGGSLADRLAAGPLEPADAARVVEQVSRGVAAAHLRGIVHRDLKPGNVLMDASGIPKVTDFGLAKRLDAGDVTLTRTGAFLGTPAYMAPEQATRDGTVGPATDVYALGNVLFECLTGRRPFAHPSALDVLHAIAHDPPPDPCSLRRNVPRDLATIVLKCLCKSPRDRYPDAGELADDLERWRNLEPIRARRAGALERAHKWTRRNPVVTALFAALSIAMMFNGMLTLRSRWATSRAKAAEADARGQAERANRNAEEAQRERRRADERAEAATRERDRVEGLLTTVRIDRSLQAWAADLGPAAFAALDGVRWDHHGRLEYRLARRAVRTAGRVEVGRHEFGATAVDWSPDGATLVSSGGDGTVRVWDAATGRQRRALAAGLGVGVAVHAVAWSPDGTRIAAAVSDGVTRVWAADGSVVRRLPASADPPTAVAWSPDGTTLAVGAGAGGVRLWDARTGAAKGESTPAGWVRGLAFSPDGTRLACAETAGLRVLDAGTGAERLRPAGAGGGAAAWSPDGTRLLAPSRAGGAAVWDARTGARLVEMRGPAADARGAAWSADGTRVAVASGDGFVRFWDARTGLAVRCLRGHGDAAAGVAFSPDGTRLATSCEDGCVRVWDALADADQPTLGGAGRDALSLAWSPDGARLAIADGAAGVRAWDAATGRDAALTAPEKFTPLAVAWSRDGRLAAAGADGPIRLWDTAGAPVGKLERAAGASRLAWSPDGSRLAGVSGDQRVRVWDARALSLEAQFEAHPWAATPFAWSPDGSRLAAAGADGRVRVRAAPDWSRPVLELSGPLGLASCLAWSPDGGTLAVGQSSPPFEFALNARPREILLFDARTGAPRARLAGHAGPVADVAWSPDGSRLASVGRDRMLRLWDADAGAQALAIDAGVGEPKCLAWRPDGGALAIGGDGGLVRLWDARPDDGPVELLGHAGAVPMAGWSADGRSILSWDATRSLIRHDAATGELLPADGAVPVVARTGAVCPDGSRVVEVANRRVRVRPNRAPAPVAPVFPLPEPMLRAELRRARLSGDTSRALALCQTLLDARRPAPRADILADALKAEPASLRWRLAEAHDRLEAGAAFRPPALGADAPLTEVRAALALAALSTDADARAALRRATDVAAESGSPDDRLTVALLRLRAGERDAARRELDEVRSSRGRASAECEYGLAILAGDARLVVAGDALPRPAGDWQARARLDAWRRAASAEVLPRPRS